MSEVTKKVTYQDLPPHQQAWINYSAVQGVITESDGSLTKMSITEFARKIGVGRRTLYDWTRTIPDFDNLVAQQRKRIGGGARVNKVWNSVYVAATNKLDMTAARMYLANFDPNYREPTQKVEHEAGGGILDLMATHRQRIQIENQKVIDAEPADNA